MRYLIFSSLVLLTLTAAAQNKKATNISVLLPFSSKYILENPNHPKAELGNLCREYYQGMLIALDSFERAKTSIRLSVFDTEDDSLVTVDITKKAAFKESELIIGPVRLGGNKVVSNFSKSNNVFHISPLMTFSKSKLEDPYWVSANPDLPSYATILYQQIIKQQPDAQITVVADKSATGKSIGAAFKQLAAEKKVKIKVVDYGAGFTITPHTAGNTQNHIIIASTNEQCVNAVLRSIKDTSSVAGLHTYGFMQWFDFKNTEYNLLQRCNVVIATPFFVDYQQPEVKQFILAYRNRFNTEPTEAAFKGFDQLMLLGFAAAEKGKKLMDVLENNTYPLLGSTYCFTKQKEGGYQNKYLYFLKLDGFALKKLN